ncbi:hypothetical protein G3O00_28310 [Burkholderia sp. Ac-20384]|uniref:hypothetical protein n=1 Tax=Burkholderia sp. Ac-20384 TaxID=2703902 RepID=UPI00197E757F|nr:hypothetical protein [Burkholderia sp. Ac-20384]MBN3827502.1 hypothetical protein [Burkholderia sp. Ac-20384]
MGSHERENLPGIEKMLSNDYSTRIGCLSVCICRMMGADNMNIERRTEDSVESEWYRLSEYLTGEAGPIGERWLQCVHEAVRETLKGSVNRQISSDAGLAYEVGLVGGFYGVKSFIVEVGRKRFAERLYQLRRYGKCKEYNALLRDIERVGRAHGLLIGNRVWTNHVGSPEAIWCNSGMTMDR